MLLDFFFFFYVSSYLDKYVVCISDFWLDFNCYYSSQANSSLLSCVLPWKEQGLETGLVSNGSCKYLCNISVQRLFHNCIEQCASDLYTVSQEINPLKQENRPLSSSPSPRISPGFSLSVSNADSFSWSKRAVYPSGRDMSRNM